MNTSHVHLSPERDSPFAPCCLRWFQELPLGDRVTSDPARVTCPGPGVTTRPIDKIKPDPAPRHIGILTRVGRLLRSIGCRR